MFELSQRSLDNLKGVHPDLVAVVKEAIKRTSVDFMVIEGLRTLERQKKLVASGASQTLNSRHLTGHAVDLAAWVDGTVRWDWPLYHRIAAVVKEAAQDLKVPIEWGGDWTSFKDGPHWQLPFIYYPKDEGHKKRLSVVPTQDEPLPIAPSTEETRLRYLIRQVLKEEGLIP